MELQGPARRLNIARIIPWAHSPGCDPSHQCFGTFPLRQLNVLNPQSNVRFESLQRPFEYVELPPDKGIVGDGRWRLGEV